MVKSLGNKWLAAAALSSAFILAACGGGAGEGSGAASASGGTATQTAGKTYVAATDASYAPFESMDDKGNVVGFDHDILQAAADKAGIKVTFKNTPWEGIFATLAQGDRDLVISSVTITDERKQSMDFTDSYFDATQMIALAEGNTDIKVAADLKNKKVAVQTGTTGDEVVSKILGKTNPNIKRLESMPLALKELVAGGVDAVVGDNGVVQNFVNHNPEAKLKTIVDPSFAKEHYGIAVKKGRNDDLLKKLNEGIAGIKADGTYQKIYDKYFGKADAGAKEAASAASGAQAASQ